MDFGIGRVLPVNIEDEMKNSYIDYAMSVIVMRALPDVRDGLKPVHRRILYAMQEAGMASNKPYKKSARIVGEVLGKYHPHGDSSVYEAIVRMAQNFSSRYMLADGHGNFGSVADRRCTHAQSMARATDSDDPEPDRRFHEKSDGWLRWKLYGCLSSPSYEATLRFINGRVRTMITAIRGE